MKDPYLGFWGCFPVLLLLFVSLYPPSVHSQSGGGDDGAAMEALSKSIGGGVRIQRLSMNMAARRTTSSVGEWLQSDKIWSGRLRVVSCKDRCEIRLEDQNSSELFAAYFVLKIDDGTGKHTFIGLGFAERNKTFDFNVALSDHEKYVKRKHEKESNGGETSDDCHIDIHPAVNHRLKEGETIRINVKPKPQPTSGAGMLSSSGIGLKRGPEAVHFLQECYGRNGREWGNGRDELLLHNNIINIRLIYCFLENNQEELGQDPGIRGGTAVQCDHADRRPRVD
ncbi:hypothetical protein EV2_025769 [Malus domestica]